MVLVFFLWMCLKECLYINRPNAKQELVCVIWDEIANVNQGLLARVFDNCVEPLRQCAANEGGNLQDIIDLSI
jgi:hypothetical protein